MKINQFNIAIAGIPRRYAVFKVNRVPGHIVCADLEVGDLMYWNNHRGQMVRVHNSMCLSVEPMDLDFITYMTVGEMQEVTHVSNA